jgi:hypothetical protein
LRARDARHEFHRQRLEPGRGISLDPRAIAERIERGDYPRARLDAGKAGRIGPLHRQHDIRAGQCRCAIADLGARIGISRIRDGRGFTRPGLDRERCTECDELLHRLRRGGDAFLARCSLFHDCDADAHLDQRAMIRTTTAAIQKQAIAPNLKTLMNAE